METVLIVDDEKPIREMIRAMVEPVGYKVIEAGNGDEAVRLCSTEKVDVIVTDIVMPEVNGIDLIMAIKKEHPSIPVIAISGGGGIAGRYDYLEIAKLVGAKNVLKKPFSMEDIRSLVASVLKE